MYCSKVAVKITALPSTLGARHIALGARCTSLCRARRRRQRLHRDQELKMV
jgi:hypothetical protein